MFSSGPSYPKLKTNLRLAINRLKLMEKKKSELAQKARKEIADYISIGKSERAKIRVEHIIREDYLVEAMEVTEMYCDLLLARFGLIQQMKDLDEGMAEPISSLIWVAPRLQTDIAELKVIGDQLALKYGKPYAQACREQAVATISEKLIHKLSVQAPPKVMVEKYLIEIAKNYNIDYEPDPQILREAEWAENPLINFEDKNNLGGGSGGASGGGGGGGASGGGGGYNIPLGFHDGPQPFNYPDLPEKSGFPGEMNFPTVPGQLSGPPPPGMSVDTMPNNLSNNLETPTKGGQQWNPQIGNDQSPPPPYSSMEHGYPTPASAPPPSLPYGGQGGSSGKPNFPPDINSGMGNLKGGGMPKPAPRSKFDEDADFPNLPDVPSLPDVPGFGSPHHKPKNNEPDEDIDFDDLNKRFEQLKKK